MVARDILSTYAATGLHFAAVVTPYSLRLLYLMILVETLTLGITWMMGSDDPREFGWRIVRLVFTAGLAYWWLVNCWTLGVTVIGSFNELGKNITQNPDLTPANFVDLGVALAKILWNAPSAAGYIPEIPLAIGKIALALTVFLILLVVAGLAIFTITVGYLIIGPASILVAFLPCRFTSTMSEGYFTWLVRTGITILFFFVVLGTAQSFVGQWTTELAGECHAMGGICTAPIPLESLFSLLGSTVVLAFIAVGVPFSAAAIVTHGVNMAIEHLAAAKYLAAGSGRRVAGAASGLSRQISRAFRSSNQRSTLEQRMAAGAAAASQVAASRQTAPLPSRNAYGVQRTQQLGKTNGAQPTSKI